MQEFSVLKADTLYLYHVPCGVSFASSPYALFLTSPRENVHDHRDLVFWFQLQRSVQRVRSGEPGRWRHRLLVHLQSVMSTELMSKGLLFKPSNAVNPFTATGFFHVNAWCIHRGILETKEAINEDNC